MNILLIDDHAVVRAMIRRLVGDDNYSFLEAGSAADGLAILETDDSIALVLCDYLMPGLTGLDFATRLRALPNHAKTPLVIVSATRNKDLIAEGQARGVTFWLFKPFTRDQLMDTIAAHSQKGPA